MKGKGNRKKKGGKEIETRRGRGKESERTREREGEGNIALRPHLQPISLISLDSASHFSPNVATFLLGLTPPVLWNDICIIYIIFCFPNYFFYPSTRLPMY